MTARLGVVGVGVMGEALCRGLVESGWAPADLVVCDLRAERARAVSEGLGCRLASRAADAAASAESVLLAVKPQDALAALDELAGALGGGGLVSIVAGLTTPAIEERLGRDVGVVRAMPNTPARIRRGVTALTAGRWAGDALRRLANEVFGAVGPVVWLDERQLDAVTAISGSGPAYVFLVAEALVEAGVALGLAREVAETLVAATIEGSGAMLRELPDPAPVLRAQVTSPGGTTAAALLVLEAMAVRAAFGEAVRAAYRRSRELGS